MSLLYLLGNLNLFSRVENSREREKKSDNIYKYLKEKTSDPFCRKGYYSYSDLKKDIKFVKVCK